MESIKKIDLILPFNDLFFKGCFYNSLFSVVKYYDKSILPILINNIACYSYVKDYNQTSIKIDFCSIIELDKLLNEMGIIQIDKPNNLSFIENTIKSINYNKPVIVDIDCFFMPIRPEDYLKRHLLHTVLIYGYDNVKRVFNIIEQKFADSLSYYKTEISYEDLYQSYKGYLDVVGSDTSKCTYREYDLFRKNDCPPDELDRCMYIYKQNIHRNLKTLRSSICSLEQFIKDYEMIFMNESLLSTNIDSLIDGLNHIINAKKVERYKLQSLFGNQYYPVKLIEQIENTWNLMRYKLMKYKLSSLYKAIDFIELKKNIESICSMEKSIYDIQKNIE